MGIWELKTKIIITPPEYVESCEDEKVNKVRAIASAVECPQELKKHQDKHQDSIPRHIIHPLSGEKREIHLTRENIKAAFKKAKELLEKDISDEKLKFLTMWRFFGVELKENLGANIPFLPYSTSAPAWDFIDVVVSASAIAGTIKNGEIAPAFLIFSIASAYSFIANARRTVDLWAGSYLLSYLSWKGMKVIVEKYGPDALVYPDLRGKALVDIWLKEKGVNKVETPSPDRLVISELPSLWTAIVPASENDIGEKVKEEIEKSFKDIADKCREYVEEGTPSLKGNHKWKEIWDRQINNFLEKYIFYVFLPWKTLNADLMEELWFIRKTESREDEAREDEVRVVERLIKDKDEKDINQGVYYPILSRIGGVLFSARKNLRHFKQAEEPGEKCTLCGERQALDDGRGAKSLFDELRKIDRKRDELRNLDIERKDVEDIKLKGRIREGEVLCAVCLTKRLCLEAYFEKEFKKLFEKELGESKVDHHMFPSTATVACAEFVKGVIEKIKAGNKSLEDKLKNFVEYLIEKFGENSKHILLYPSSSLPYLVKMSETNELLKKFLRIDGQWLYEDTYNQKRIKNEFGEEVSEEDLQNARRILKEFLKEAEKNGLKRPRKYFAIVAMDGDNMSKWLSGRRALEYSEITSGECPPYLSGYKIPLGPSYHRVFTTALSNFALNIVRKIIEEEHPGKLVYAGGDDILAFLPLDYLFEVMHKLRKMFSEDFWDNGKHTIIFPGKKMSMSAGVAIAHVKHPLSHAVEEAHSIMEVAKEVELKEKNTHDKEEKWKKDAFMVRMMKRAGSWTYAGCRWFSEDGKVDVVEALKSLAEFMKRDALSPRLISSMEEIADMVPDEDVELIKKEIKRQVYRHANQDEKDKVFGEIEKILSVLITLDFKKFPDEVRNPWNALSGLLELVKFTIEED